MLVDDGNSAVSFPETPLLAVFARTGGPHAAGRTSAVRRDRADVVSAPPEDQGQARQRTGAWSIIGLRRSKWDEVVAERPQAPRRQSP